MAIMQSCDFVYVTVVFSNVIIIILITVVLFINMFIKVSLTTVQLIVLVIRSNGMLQRE